MIVQQANLSHLPPDLADKYLGLLLRFKDCISTNKFEVGRCTVSRHVIPLIDESKAVFEKQLPLPIANRIELLRQVKN